MGALHVRVAMAAWVLFAGTAQADHPSDYVHAVCVSHLPQVTDLASSHLATDIETTSENIFNTLLGLDDNGFPTPELAQSWEVLEDGLLYRLQLRENVPFHSVNGFLPTRTLDASDVVFTLNRLLDTEAYLASIDQKVAFSAVFPRDKVESVTGDSLQVDIRLKVPDVELLEKLSGYDTAILSLEYARFLSENNRESEFLSVPVGTGAFQFSERSHNRFALNRFDDYWEGEVGLSGLVYKAEPDDLERLSRLRRGECAQALELGSRILDLGNNFRGYYVQRSPILSVLFLAVDTRQKPWDDLRARKALSLAINRQRILKLLFVASSGEHASTSIHPKLLGLSEALAMEYDPQRARRLFEKIGGGEPITLKISSFDVARPHNPNPRRMVQLVAQDLRAVGVDVSVEWVPLDNILETIARPDNSAYEGVLMGYSADVPLASHKVELLLGCTDGQPDEMNFSRMCDPQLEHLIDQASNEFSPQKRQHLYRAVASASLAKMQYVNLLHAEHVDVVRADVEGIKRSSNGYLDFRKATRRMSTRH